MWNPIPDEQDNGEDLARKRAQSESAKNQNQNRYYPQYDPVYPVQSGPFPRPTVNIEESPIPFDTIPSGGYPPPNHNLPSQYPPNGYYPPPNQPIPTTSSFQSPNYLPPNHPNYSTGGYPPPSLHYPPSIPTHIPPSHPFQQTSPTTFPMNASHSHPTSQPFQYRKKALLIGINYQNSSDSRARLKGCINDVRNMREFLKRYFHFPEEKDNMLILTDDQKNPKLRPTKFNIIAAMQWLVKDARPGDSLFLHYSGHGGQVKDTNGDELDGFDETILPEDYRESGQIVDDQMHAILVKNLPPGVKLTAIFDSCHSGTALDLPFIYNVRGELTNTSQNPIQLFLRNKMKKDKKQKKHKKSKIGKIFNLLEEFIPNDTAQIQHIQKTKGSPADVVMFSSSRDDQTSADAFFSNYGAIGAMSYAIIRSMEKNPKQTYAQLLHSTRGLLSSRFSQIPQLSSSHPMDMNQVFTI